MIDFKNLSKSKTIHGIIIGIVTVLVVLVIFQAGMFVGYHKARFANQFGENYYRNFGEPGSGMMGGMMRGFGDRDLPSGHGAIGKIVRLSLPTITVAGSDNLEKTILLTDDTVIRKLRSSIKATDLKIDDFIVVIGSPNDTGQVIAKLIRLMPTPPVALVATSTKTN